MQYSIAAALFWALTVTSAYAQQTSPDSVQTLIGTLKAAQAYAICLSAEFN